MVWIKNLIRIVSLLLLLFSGELSVAMEIVTSPPVCKTCSPGPPKLIIPNFEIKLIWEHSCIKHIEKQEYNRARQIKSLIEWQLTNKKGLDAFPSYLTEAQYKLEEAEEAKKRAGDLWGCNPPEARLELKKLQVGHNEKSNLTDSFITNSKDSLKISAEAVLIEPECENPRLIWTVAIPKYNGSGEKCHSRMIIAGIHV